MKKGYRVINIPALRNDNCIAVENYNIGNFVYNTPFPIKMIESIKDKNTIGVWKIKNKN